MPRPIAIIGAPTAIGISPYRDGRARQLHLMPGVLRELGLVQALAAEDFGDVPAEVPYRDVDKPDGRVRNDQDLAAYSQRLGRRIAEVSAGDYFLVLLGGDCSILLGSLVGLRERRPDLGLVYIDAHADFATLKESPSGSACSMNLALAVGRWQAGPIGRLAGESPLVQPGQVVHLGRRDEHDAAYGDEALRRSAIADVPARLVRARGPEAVARETLARVAAAPGGFWIHFDVDVLDPSLMPAVDSPIPDWFSPGEVKALLEPLVQHPAALGLQLTIYDPTLDPQRHAARLLVDLLAEELARSR
jgi:arginase